VPIDAFAQHPWHDGRGRPRGAKFKNRLKRERMTNTKLTHYAIRTTDLEASRRFYTEVMGFHFGYRPPPRLAWPARPVIHWSLAVGLSVRKRRLR